MNIEWTHFRSDHRVYWCRVLPYANALMLELVRRYRLGASMRSVPVWCFRYLSRLVRRETPPSTPQSGGPLIIFVFVSVFSFIFILIFVFIFILISSFSFIFVFAFVFVFVFVSSSLSAGPRIGATTLGRAKIRRAVLLQHFVAAGLFCLFCLCCVVLCCLVFAFFCGRRGQGSTYCSTGTVYLVY